MRIFIAAVLLLFGAPQASQVAPGTIEGRVSIASNSQSISGVQVILTSPPSSVTVTTAPVPPEAQTRINDLIRQGQQAGATQAQIDSAVTNLRRNLGLLPPEPT